MATVTRLDGTPVILVSKCTCCGRSINSNNEGFFSQLCELCYESAGVYNEHENSNGEHPGMNPGDCPQCAGVECMHEVSK